MNQETRNYEAVLKKCLEDNERRILDSGARREFETGAVRDIQEGKGRCDLLPLEVIGDYLMSSKVNSVEYQTVANILENLDYYINYDGNIQRIHTAIRLFVDMKKWSPIGAVLEVAKHYEQGAKKYAERNWEKGIPCHCYVDSGVRHLLKWLDGWDDEPHDRAFLWNMFCLLWTVQHKSNLNDLPFYVKRKEQMLEEAGKAEDRIWGTPEDRKLRRDIIEATECSNKIQKAMEETENGKCK